MTLLLFLSPLSLVLLAAAAWAFVWAVRRGQFDDMDTPAIDILRDDPHERLRWATAQSAATPAGATADAPIDPDSDAHAD